MNGLDDRNVLRLNEPNGFVNFGTLYVVEGSTPRKGTTMKEKTVFDVEIADASGHSVVQMSQNEIAEKATQSQGTWVFVNDQLVSAADVASMNLDAGSRIRLMPGLVGGADAPTFEVEIADSTGHSTAVMTQAEIAESANRSAGTWVFVNDQLVSAADVASMNLDAGSRIRLMPGLVGGLTA